MIGGRGTIDYLEGRVAGLEIKCDALAAHVERLREELRDRAVQAWCGCEHPACNRCKDDADTEKVLAEKPITSLARRDLIKQAEALIEESKSVMAESGYLESFRKEVAYRLRRKASYLQQQAESLQ